MLRNLDTTALRSLVAVIEAGGVTKAANRMHLTQSAVSMQIKRLEETLDLKLLERDGRGVAPTSAGEQLAGYARQILAINDEALERLTAPRFEGEVTLGMPCDMVYPHAPSILRQFSEEYPRVQLKFVSSYTRQLLEGFSSGIYDVIVTTEDGAGEGGETIAKIPLRWYGAPGGRAWSQSPLPFATARMCAFRPSAARALDQAGISWHAATIAENEDAAVAATRADLSVMALLDGAYPDWLCAVDHSGRLPELPVIAVNLYTNTAPERQELARELASCVKRPFMS